MNNGEVLAMSDLADDLDRWRSKLQVARAEYERLNAMIRRYDPATNPVLEILTAQEARALRRYVLALRTYSEALGRAS